VAISRQKLLRSLEHQRELFATSIVLTPVDSLPFCLADREHTAFLHGLYLTDKVRDRDVALDTVIQFGGREDAARDIAEIHNLLAERLGAAEGSLRLLAGLQAHAATFMAVADIGQTVMLLPDDAGGHFNSHAILKRLGLRTVDMPIDYEHLCIDREATLELVEREKPDFVFVDRSEGLRYEDFSFLGSLEGPVKIFDASQYLTPLLTDRYENPLHWGFDLMLFTLHKSFPGPQKAGIVARENSELWKALLAGLSTFVSSSHAENSYLFGLSLLQDQWLDTYASRFLETTLALERQLEKRGVPLVPRGSQGMSAWPSTHHLWTRAEDRETAFLQYERLMDAGVLVNYRKLPYRLGYGLRLGTTHAAVAGIDPTCAEDLADIIQASIEGRSGADLRDRVRDLASTARKNAILPVSYWT
jgi:glycine hydroxymethyltransferase